MRRTSGAALSIGLVLTVAACASAPPAPSGPPPPTINEKLAWILRLEDQRVLRDPAPELPPPPAVPARGRAAPAPPPAPPVPDLLRLLTDPEPRVRRRAALAVGRVGLDEGVPALSAALADPDPEVRQMAAFGLGLIGDGAARDALAKTLDEDQSWLVKGRAAEALGLIGDPAAAAAIGSMAAEIFSSGALADLPGDEEDALQDTPAAAYRLALFALVRLKGYDALAAAALDARGQPKLRWWPLAYALQRIEDPRGAPALRTLLDDPHPYTRAFAARGLGTLKEREAVPALVKLIASPDRAVAVEAIRALGRIGDRAAGPPLLAAIRSRTTDPMLRAEAVAAIGSVGGEGASETLLDILGDRTPAVRAAALGALAKLDPEGFVFVLSGLDPDPHWSVRAALASILGTLTPEAGLPRLRALLEDPDDRVIPAALAAYAALNPSDAAEVMIAHLEKDDFLVRAAAATAIGQLKPASGPQALAAAYRAGRRDQTYVARAAALAALARFGSGAAVPALKEALEDSSWAVRLRAAALLEELDPAAEPAAAIRPAPTRHPPTFYDAAGLVEPPVSTQVYIETDRGTIQIELAVLDAPLTVENFITLARKGFYDGLLFHRVVPNFVIQGGDPRGDGEGGPGYAIRDELSERPYLRGTVGMALDWADTGGSQFFITHSPQPHLDARYTVFGRVLSGMEVVDQIQQGDVMRRVRVWDGQTPLNQQ